MHVTHFCSQLSICKLFFLCKFPQNLKFVIRLHLSTLSKGYKWHADIVSKSFLVQLWTFAAIFISLIILSQLATIMSERFSVEWNDYHQIWKRSLSELRKETDFSDVTLVTDDKVKFSAHRILLSSCSKTLNFILKDNIHSKPLLYLKWYQLS